MANMMLRSGFLGQTLEQGAQMKSAPSPVQKTTQALFGKKQQKEAKQAPKKAASGFDKLKQAAGGAAQKAQKQVKRSGPAAPSPKKAGSQIKKAAKKAAPKGTKGWLGGAGGAKDLDKFYGSDRDLFLPGGLLDRNDIPSYLDGTLPGDYGYDPLSLGKNPEQVGKFRANELIHARWAMLAAAGIIIPEGLQANGADIKGGTWFETGAEMLNGGTLNYFAVPWAIIGNPLPLAVVTLIEVVLIGAAEQYRAKGEGPPGYSPGVGKFDSDIFSGLDNLYPGGPFDPLGLADDPEVFQELQVKEIKNGRLALVAVLAFAVQGYVTGEGPYANWAKHVSDPFGYNLLTILGNEDRLPTL